MLLYEIAETSRTLAETSARLKKIDMLASCLRRLRADEVRVAVDYLSGELPQGSIGIGWAYIRGLPEGAARAPSLQILDVDEALSRIATATGRGSQAARRRELADLYGRATEQEQRFLTALLLGELRQGALEGVMIEAIARAAGVASSDVRRAFMVAGDLSEVATAAIANGRNGLANFALTLLQPLQPMLAQTATDLQGAMTKVHPAAVEWKVDGARIQAHKAGDEVRIFTRNLADISARVPEIVEALHTLPVNAVILDGEAIALRENGRPHPFQVTMSRFGSRLGVEELRRSVPLSTFFFDCLHLDGDDLIDLPYAQRFNALAKRLPADLIVPRMVARNGEEAEPFLESALSRGHEGVMVKALDAPYEAGRRGAGWLKVKKAHTLDLVVLAAEWGHGRRQGWLSNLHLGARDTEGEGYVMLGKTFKGMTDEMLVWQTERLLELETGREGIVVHVRPELVVEVAFDGVQRSSRYPGGLALRFARVKGYRHDKTPQDADTIDAVRAFYTGDS
jgi:ATP-dependent DNA ligase I